MQYMTPSHDERIAAFMKFQEDKAEEHREERERERKEKEEEEERQRIIAIDAALERIRDVPLDQAPPLRERGELHWAEEQAWWIREWYQCQADRDAVIQAGADAPETPEPVVPPGSHSQGKGEDGVETTVEGNGQGHGHENTAAVAPHMDGGVDMSGWDNDPSFIALRDPNFEPWIVKQKRLQREREEREREQVKKWQLLKARREQKKKEQEKGKQEEAQQSACLQHHEDPATPAADYLRSLLPADFPRYRNIHGMNDMGAYLANASYAVSLGGPPSADLKYGIIVVPVGDEGTLFGQQPSDVMTPEFIREVYDLRYARHLAADQDFHEAARDSGDFLQPRFKSVPSIDRSWHSLEGVVDPAAVPADPDEGHGLHEGDKAVSQPAGLDGGPELAGAASEAVNRDDVQGGEADETNDAVEGKGET